MRLRLHSLPSCANCSQLAAAKRLASGGIARCDTPSKRSLTTGMAAQAMQQAGPRQMLHLEQYQLPAWAQALEPHVSCLICP